MRTLALVVLSLCLSGCAYYLTPRPPIMERKLGSPFSPSVGALATAADYRMVYVKIKPQAQFCAEPPPDAAGQFAASLAAALSKPLAPDTTLSASAQASMALSMKQLFKRSQGVQFYRDGLFALCNAYVDGAISPESYVSEIEALRKAAAELVLKEIPHLSEISFDPTIAPSLGRSTSGESDTGQPQPKTGDVNKNNEPAGNNDPANKDRNQ